MKSLSKLTYYCFSMTGGGQSVLHKMDGSSVEHSRGNAYAPENRSLFMLSTGARLMYQTPAEALRNFKDKMDMRREAILEQISSLERDLDNIERSVEHARTLYKQEMENYGRR